MDRNEAMDEDIQLNVVREEEEKKMAENERNTNLENYNKLRAKNFKQIDEYLKSIKDHKFQYKNDYKKSAAQRYLGKQQKKIAKVVLEKKTPKVIKTELKIKEYLRNKGGYYNPTTLVWKDPNEIQKNLTDSLESLNLTLEALDF